MIQEKLSRIYKRCKDNVTLPWIMPLDEIQFRHSFAAFIVEIVLFSCNLTVLHHPSLSKSLSHVWTLTNRSRWIFIVLCEMC